MSCIFTAHSMGVETSQGEARQGAWQITCLAAADREGERERDGECVFLSRNQFVALIMHRLWCCCCCCRMNAFLATCGFVVLVAVVSAARSAITLTITIRITITVTIATAFGNNNNNGRWGNAHGSGSCSFSLAISTVHSGCNPCCTQKPSPSQG